MFCRFHKIVALNFLASLVLIPLLVLDSSAYEKFSNPVIFIHGIASDATTWQDFGKILKQNLLTVGGCVTFNRSIGGLVQGIFVEGLCESTTHAISQGDFYLMQFSDNSNLTFNQQAEELRAIIDAVSTANGQAKVILVAHSMGGLVARSYLQQLAPIDNKVLKLITVGTPHMGAEITHICQNSDFCRLRHISPSSIGIAELDPTTSSALKELNALNLHPLPTQISYASIIGIGVGALIINDGDGIVSKSSQDLGNVLKNNGILHLHHTAISIFIPSCFDPFEVHTCETGDKDIQDEILNHIYQCDTINFETGMPSGSSVTFGAPYNVFSQQHELLLPARCTNTSTTAQIGPATYVYSQGYAWDGTKWNQLPFTCTGGSLVSGVWCPQSAQGTLPNTATFYVAYTCTWTGSQWKCGCKDQPFQLDPCTPSAWQLQGIQR